MSRTSDNDDPTPLPPEDAAYVAYLEQQLDKKATVAEELQRKLEAAVAQWSMAYQWCEAVRQQLSILRTTRGWKALRSLRQVKAQLIDQRDGGSAAFFRALFSQGRSASLSNANRFDPFWTVDALPYPQPPDALARIAERVAAPNRPEERESHPRKLLPPRELRQGIPGQGRCDVIVPVKGALHWLEQCLSSFFRATTENDYCRVIVVDDGTPSDEVEALEALSARYPAIFLLRNEGPRGFAGACHAGAGYGNSPYLLFLNSDCLVTEGAVSGLVEALDGDATIGLACALSNNAANVSVPLQPGEHYVDVARFLASDTVAAGKPADICTVVGHCLLVSRRCWDATGGFDVSWGLGYGEESDLHLRALERGFRGVAVPTVYVYHFGGGTFRYQEARASLQQSNYERFQSLWGERYTELLASCQAEDPVPQTERALSSVRGRSRSTDVLFVLPGISQSVGGTQVVIDIAEALMRSGIDARILILGSADVKQLYDFKEALFSHPILIDSEEALVSRSPLSAKIVVSTLYKTIPGCHRFARSQGSIHINFVQGYECFFDQGTRYDEVAQLYHVADRTIVTSEWLRERVSSHRVTHPISKLPLGISSELFFPATGFPERRESAVRLGMVLRHGPDKGQWVLREALAELLRGEGSPRVTVFAGPEYEFTAHDNVKVVRTPVDRYTLARELRAVDIFLDASFHEGFGLLPLEAMGCGATVVASDSGGVREFIRDGENGWIVAGINDPAAYVSIAQRLIRDRELLSTCRRAAADTARAFSDEAAFRTYAEYFKTLL